MGAWYEVALQWPPYSSRLTLVSTTILTPWFAREIGRVFLEEGYYAYETVLMYFSRGHVVASSHGVKALFWFMIAAQVTTSSFLPFHGGMLIWGGRVCL